MDFSLSDEQKALKQIAADFTKNEIAPLALEWDKSGEFPWAVFQKFADLGLHCTWVPEEYGGSGQDTFSTILVMEEIAKGCAGFATAIAALDLAAQPILVYGKEEQKKKYFDLIASGTLAGFCLTEPDAGSDAGAVKTCGVREGGEYVIHGNKRFITNGSLAGVYTVIAATDIKSGIEGLSAFIVERDRPGVSIGKHEDKMGIRCSDTTEVLFDHVRIPVENLLGKEGDGFRIAMQALDMGRTVCAAMALGVGQSALDHAVDYSKQRMQFGKPICANQGIQFLLANMAIEMEAARQLTYYAAYLQDTGGCGAVKAASMAKTFASDTAMKVTVDAVQVYGGYGYIKDYPMEKLMRDAKILQIFEGTNQIQRKVIAGQLLNGR